jgi:phage terminase large subunit-like protein
MTARRQSSSHKRCGFTFAGKSCAKRGDHFCVPRADRAQRFIEKMCVHTKSIWARKPFVLEDWQRDEIVRPLFGEVRWDDQWQMYVRLYSVALIEIARGNGKSELAAAIVLLLLVGDDEESAEVYGAASDTKQAGKVGEVAKRMAELSPHLSRRLVFNRQSRRLIDPKKNSYYEVIPSDAKGELGHNPSGSVIDEVLTQASADLWEALRTAQGKRPESLLIGFTTAGNDPSSFAAKLHEEMEKIVEDPSRAPHVFAYLRNTPKEADPFDEKNWFHANPALGKFLSIETVRQEALEARNDPTRENAFRQFRLNQWVQQVTRWMPLHLWDQCAGMIDETKLQGLECYGGLDMSATSDLTALSWFFPGRPHQVIRRFFIPEARVPFLDKQTGNAFSVWVKEGFVHAIPGEVIDDKVVRDQIIDDATAFQCKMIGIDRWNALSIANSLEEIGLETTLIKQGFALSPGLKELMRLVKARDSEGRVTFNHGGNPVSRWMADAVEVKRDDNENLKPVKPDRDASGKRIDGIVTDAMAIMCWMLDSQEEAVDNTLYSY